MSDLAIRVVGVSKRFSVDERNPWHATRELLENLMRAPFRRFSSVIRQPMYNHNGWQLKDKYVWALKDVSFEARRGGAVGIIGANGAGKSVLLKILSRITRPTEGYSEIYVKVG